MTDQGSVGDELLPDDHVSVYDDESLQHHAATSIPEQGVLMTGNDQSQSEFRWMMPQEINTISMLYGRARGFGLRYWNNTADGTAGAGTWAPKVVANACPSQIADEDMDQDMTGASTEFDEASMPDEEHEQFVEEGLYDDGEMDEDDMIDCM